MCCLGSLTATLVLAMAGDLATAAEPMAAQAASEGAQQAAQDEAAAAVSPDYRIGPGDTLKVSVFQNDNLTVTLPVRPDGKISTPLVEDMVAVGKSPSQLARDIEKSLAEYIKSPKVRSSPGLASGSCRSGLVLLRDARRDPPALADRRM